MCLKCVPINSILTSFCAYIFAELSGGITLTARYICVSVYGCSLSPSQLLFILWVNQNFKQLRQLFSATSRTSLNWVVIFGSMLREPILLFLAASLKGCWNDMLVLSIYNEAYALNELELRIWSECWRRREQ